MMNIMLKEEKMV